MRALFLSAPGRFEYRDTAPAQVPAEWVRVRMRYAGICGSDIHYYAAGRIGDQVVRFPFVLGHEGTGEVATKAGDLAAGTAVFIEPAVVCHRCDQCLSGRENTCRNLQFLGNPAELPGCMCDEISMPPECLLPLPAWMTPQEGVLLEPLSIGIHSVSLSHAGKECRAAIVGSGPIGLVVLLALGDIHPRKVLVSEPVPARREAAMALGATATYDPGREGAACAIWDDSEGGADVVFECAGTQESIDDAARMLRPGGTLVLIGIPEGVDRITYDPHLMRRREATVVSVRRQNRCTEHAVALLERRRDAATVLLTHTFAPVRAKQAFDLVQNKADGAIKVLIEL